MPDSITIDVPFPPSANAIWRSPNGKVFKSKSYNRWLKEAKLQWMMQKPRLSPKSLPGFYKLDAVFYPPDKRERDLGNLEKACSDFAQTVGVIANDCKAREIHLIWGSSTEAPLGARLKFTSMI